MCHLRIPDACAKMHFWTNVHCAHQSFLSCFFSTRKHSTRKHTAWPTATTKSENKRLRRRDGAKFARRDFRNSFAQTSRRRAFAVSFESKKIFPRRQGTRRYQRRTRKDTKGF